MEPRYSRQHLIIDENTQLMLVYRSRLAVLMADDHVDPTVALSIDSWRLWKQALATPAIIIVLSVYMLIGLIAVFILQPTYFMPALTAAVALTFVHWLWLRMTVLRLRRKMRIRAWQYARTRVHLP